MKVDNLKLTKSLGKGAFGEVFLTQIDGKSGLYATKRLDRAYSEREENIKHLSNEIKILQKTHHPNIVNLIDLKKTKSHCYLVMEFCNGGDLTSCLKKYMEAYKRPFSEEIVQYLMRQIVSGLDALHSRNILHRDLKLDNILVCFNSETDKNSLNMLRAIVKLTDFGFATVLKEDLAHTVLGTPCNMDPSLLNNMETRTRNKGYDEKVDIWSLGTLCYEMLVGRSPFSGKSMQDLYRKVKIGTYPLPNSLSREVVFFIEGMLQQDPNKRLSCKQLLNHDFLVKNVKQFKPMDARTIPGIVAQQGGQIKINSNANINNAMPNLGATVWDIFAEQNKVNTQPINNQQVNYNYKPSYQNTNINSNYNQYTPSQGQAQYGGYPVTQGYAQTNVNHMQPNQYQYTNVMPKMQMGYYQ